MHTFVKIESNFIFFYLQFKLNPKQIKNQRIIISPLNWGMGHLSRCIPLIEQLLQQENTCFLAADQNHLSIAMQYFGKRIEYIQLDPYPFKFNTKGFSISTIFQESIPLWKNYKQENKTLNFLVKELNISIVISDHRYGFYSSKCTNIFLTHQCQLPLSRIEFPFQWIHEFLMSKFNFIWIVDTPNNDFAGNLSRVILPNSYFIGTLSRFKDCGPTSKNIDGILLISGPKEFAKICLDHFLPELHKFQNKLIIGPKSISQYIPAEYFQYFISNENWIEIDEYLCRTKLIMGFCGYSTIMDIAALNCDADLIPTPGQAEQEYLYKKQKRLDKSSL